MTEAPLTDADLARLLSNALAELLYAIAFTISSADPGAWSEGTEQAREALATAISLGADRAESEGEIERAGRIRATGGELLVLLQHWRAERVPAVSAAVGELLGALGTRVEPPFEQLISAATAARRT